MTMSNYKGYLIEAIAREGAQASDPLAREAYKSLVERLRRMDENDGYLEDAWREHSQLPDEAQRDALRIALAEYRGYDKAKQLPTVFLIDLFHAARPQEGVV